MTLFWFILTLLTLLGLVFILKPLLFIEVTNQPERKPSYLTAIILGLLLPLVSILLYLNWGNSKVVSEWRLSQKNANQVKQEIAKLGSREKIIETLQQKVQQLPFDESSAKGWYLLGKLYFNERKLSEAMSAFQKAVILKPNQPDYLLDFVSVKFYVYHKLTKEDKQLIAKILTLTPQNVNAINLLALDAYQQHDFTSAIRYWEGLLKYFPPGSDDSKNLLDMIRQAQNQIPVNKTLAASRKVSVKIDVTPMLKKQIGTNDVLFVYALEAGGSKIPLAVVRQKISSWPALIMLDGNQNMLPGRSLDNAEKIIIRARISKTGNAISSKGDLIGESEVVNLENNHKLVVITISDAVD